MNLGTFLYIPSHASLHSPTPSLAGTQTLCSLALCRQLSQEHRLWSHTAWAQISAPPLTEAAGHLITACFSFLIWETKQDFPYRVTVEMQWFPNGKHLAQCLASGKCSVNAVHIIAIIIITICRVPTLRHTHDLSSPRARQCWPSPGLLLRVPFNWTALSSVS